MKKTLINNILFWLSKNAAVLRRKDGRFLLAQEKRLGKILYKILRLQMFYCLEVAKNIPSFRGNSVKKNSLADDAFLEDSLNKIPNTKKFVETIIAYAGQSLVKGGNRSVSEMELARFGIKFSLKNAEAVKYLLDKKTLLLSNRQGNIADTTKQKIKTIISDSLNSGESYTEVAKKIMQQGESGVFSEARAKLISSHEAKEAYEAGRQMPVENFKARFPNRQMKKRWITVGDSRVTETHKQNEDDGWINYEEEFSGTGDMRPPASDNPNCRCDIAYRLE